MRALGCVICVPSVFEANPAISAIIFAPLAFACSYSSKIRVAAPSPITSPSLSASYGEGVSFGEPFLELVVGITIYAIGTAIIFYAGASSGGMDIVALILQKYTNIDVGRAVLYANSIIAVSSLFVFPNFTTGILSLVGLFMNSFVIDTVIDNFNSCKYFIVITEKPGLVAEYIMNELHHGVTVSDAVGAYTQQKKGMVHTVCRRYEAIRLRQAIKKIDENAFMVITTSSEIIGKGFRSV